MMFFVAGQYAFVDASFPNFEKSGILQSPTIWNERPRCLRVLVNMHGKYVGKFMITITSSTGTEEVFSKTGEQGEDWFEALIDLPVKEDFKVKLVCVKIGEIVVDADSWQDLWRRIFYEISHQLTISLHSTSSVCQLCVHRHWEIIFLESGDNPNINTPSPPMIPTNQIEKNIIGTFSVISF